MNGQLTGTQGLVIGLIAGAVLMGMWASRRADDLLDLNDALREELADRDFPRNDDPLADELRLIECKLAHPSQGPAAIIPLRPIDYTGLQ